MSGRALVFDDSVLLNRDLSPLPRLLRFVEQAVDILESPCRQGPQKALQPILKALPVEERQRFARATFAQCLAGMVNEPLEESEVARILWGNVSSCVNGRYGSVRQETLIAFLMAVSDVYADAHAGARDSSTLTHVHDLIISNVYTHDRTIADVVHERSRRSIGLIDSDGNSLDENVLRELEVFQLHVPNSLGQPFKRIDLFETKALAAFAALTALKFSVSGLRDQETFGALRSGKLSTQLNFYQSAAFHILQDIKDRDSTSALRREHLSVCRKVLGSRNGQ